VITWKIVSQVDHHHWGILPEREGLPSERPFDPYHSWLSIPPSEQPPNHYRLLGFSQIESDQDVIANAADRQMAYLRQFQTGPHAALSQQLLNEVAAVRICLLNPVKKAEYDRRLVEYLRQRRSEMQHVTPPSIPDNSLDFLQEGKRIQIIKRQVEARRASMIRTLWTPRHATLAISGFIGIMVAALIASKKDKGPKQPTMRPRPAAVKQLPATAPEITKGIAIDPPRPVHVDNWSSKTESNKRVEAITTAADKSACKSSNKFPPRVKTETNRAAQESAEKTEQSQKYGRLPPNDQIGKSTIAVIQSDPQTPWDISVKETTKEITFEIWQYTGEMGKNKFPPPPVPTWIIDARSSAYIKPFAVLTRHGDRLAFEWFKNASEDIASAFRECTLVIRAGDKSYTIALSSPKKSAPIEHITDERLTGAP